MKHLTTHHTAAQKTGAIAEQRVCWYLRRRGWRICARNWIGGHGEIDVVASRWRTLLIVEVRRRQTTAAAFASIDRKKITHVMSATQALIRLHGLEAYRLQYDVFSLNAHGKLTRICDIMRSGIIGW